jgi:hypothetical protein
VMLLVLLLLYLLDLDLLDLLDPMIAQHHAASIAAGVEQHNSAHTARVARGLAHCLSQCGLRSRTACSTHAASWH